jgi:hypothetical protein
MLLRLETRLSSFTGSVIDKCMQCTHTMGMNSSQYTQYTVRSVPRKLDVFLRRQARLRSKSLNRTILDYIEQATKLDMQQEDTDDNFDWIIGSNTLDDDSLRAMAELRTSSISSSGLNGRFWMGSYARLTRRICGRCWKS